MDITYKYDNNLPSDQLHHLFMLVGWCVGPETLDMQKNFNLPFINSTLAVSAWNNERLIGAVRVLSDKVIRSIIYDLLVDPEYQNKGVGSELVRRSIEQYPHTEWLVQTAANTAAYYEKLGFKRINEVFLHIPSIFMPET